MAVSRNALAGEDRNALDPDAEGAVAASGSLDGFRQWLASYWAGRGEQPARPIWNPNNRVGEETLQSVGMPDPSFRPGVFIGGGTVPVSREYLDAFGRGSQEAYDQLSLIGGMGRGGQAFPGTGSVTLASRRPLANPPPSRAVPEATPQPPPDYIVYHGSPHLFAPTERNPLGEFDPTKIGTGEGSQAYGVGAAYLGEREGVARSYKDPNTASGAPGILIDGKPVLEVLNQGGHDAGKSLALEILNRADNVFQAKTKINDYAPFDRDYRAARDWMDANADKITSGTRGGHMYEVAVHADPEHFLHWDKPLSEQSQKVQDALAKIDPDFYHPKSNEYDAAEHGQTIYQRLHNDPAKAAALLQQAGIPGIRYLDAGSRSAGEGSHNLVVFSPETLEIIRRYGLAGLLGGGAAAAASEPNALATQ